MAGVITFEVEVNLLGGVEDCLNVEDRLHAAIHAGINDEKLAEVVRIARADSKERAGVDLVHHGQTVIAVLRGFPSYPAAGHGETMADALRALAKVIETASRFDLSGKGS